MSYYNALTLRFQISRLLQLNWLNYIKDDLAGHDLKIIHLLRDPRDVISSRFRFKHYYYKVIILYRQHYRHCILSTHHHLGFTITSFVNYPNKICNLNEKFEIEMTVRSSN